MVVVYEFSEGDKIFITECEKEGRCVYCGSQKEARDHFIPNSARKTNKKRTFSKRDNIVPACQDCNLIKSNRTFENLEEARQFIQDKLSTKYQRILNLPHWEPHELEEMGLRMRKSIEASLLAKRLLQARIAWPNVDFQEWKILQELSKKLFGDKKR